MPDVGVLQLKISADASSASKSLKALQTRLSEINTLAQSNFNLGNVSTQIRNIVDSVKGDSNVSTAVKNLGTLLNAIAAFSKAKGFSLDESQVESLKSLQTIANGFKMGAAGVQLNQMRQAISEPWNIENAQSAAAAMEAMATGADRLAESGAEAKISSIAKALKEYSTSISELKTSLGEGFNIPTAVTTGQGQGFVSLGLASTQGMREGITEGTGEVVSAAKELADAAKEATKTELDIHSPSRVYHEIGLQTAAGFENGLREGLSNINVYGPLEALKNRFMYAGEEISEKVSGSLSSLRAYKEATIETGRRIDPSSFGIPVATKNIEAATQSLDGFAQSSRVIKEVETTVRDIGTAEADVAEKIRSANRATEEDIRLRKEELELANQRRLESNYAAYRELYMSKEDDWQKQVPEMYGFTPKAIEEGETYAEAMRITMQEINEYVDQYIDKMNTSSGPLLRDSIDEAMGIGRAFKDAKDSASILQNAPDIREKAIEVQTSVNNMANSMSKSQTATRVLTENMKDLDGELKQKKSDMSSVGHEAKSLASRFNDLMFGAQGLGGSFKRMFPTISGLLGRFKQLVKYRMLRAVIKQITEGFKEGMENYYYYSKAVGGDFAPAMDSAASALLQMKNSIGAAMAPLLQSLIPILHTVVNAFISLINYANQFIALLRGQASWSQAVPATTSAFGDVTNAANGANAAIKDLLADWDELNIIQSETAKTGGGSGTQAMQDALNMFEESYEFNDKIKSVVEWIKDHMDSILAIAKAIGVAILAWKVSRAFGGLLGDLASLVLGGALIDIGLRVAYEGAYEAGYNGGFNATSFIATVGGSITAAIGAAIIGYKFFGLWGSVIGGVLGLVASIGVAVYAYDKGNRQRIEESKWGSIHYTAEQIEEYARSQFTFDIDAEIEVAKAYIKNRLAAKLKLTVALAQFKASLSKASSFGVDAEIKVDTTEGQARIKALKDAADDAIDTIDALRTLIDENEKGLEFTMTNFKFVDDEGADISGDLLKALKVADTTLKDYFTDIGTQISKWIYEGEKSGWANGEYQMALELMQSQQRVMDKAEELSKQKLYDMTTASSIAGAKNAFAVQDYDTAKGIIEAEQTRYEEFYNEAVASVESQKEDLIYFASLAEAAATELESTLAKETDPAKRADIEAKISELNESAKTFTTLAEEITNDFDAKVEEKVGESKKKQIEAWTAMLQEVYGADYASRLFGKTNEGGSAFEWLDDLFGLGHSTDDWIKRVIEESGVEGAAQELYNYLYASLLDVDTTGGTKFFVETLGGNLYELIKNNEDLVRDIADGLIANTDNRQIAYDIFKSMFNLDDDTASKYIQTYTQNVWEDAINGVHAELPVKPVITEAPKTNTYAETAPEEDVNIWDLMPEQSEGYDFQIDRDIDAEGFINDLQDEILTIDPVVVDVTPNFTMEDADPSIFEKAAGISSKMQQSVMSGIASVYNAAQGLNLFGGMPSDITIHEERDNEQEASNTAEGVRRGNADLVTGQGQANNYMAQMVRYLAIIAQKSGSVPLAQSALGGMVSAAMEAFGNITG